MSEVKENTNTTNTNKIVEEKVTITVNPKPFRGINYDNYDILYAAHMKRMFIYVESDIKEEFNIFTENLIDENAICRNRLLNAIDSLPYKFQYKSIINNDNDNDTKTITDTNTYSNWMRFTDEAFNYRPYQPCIIS